MDWEHATGGTPDVDFCLSLYYEELESSAPPSVVEAEWVVT